MIHIPNKFGRASLVESGVVIHGQHVGEKHANHRLLLRHGVTRSGGKADEGRVDDQAGPTGSVDDQAGPTGSEKQREGQHGSEIISRLAGR